MRPQKMENIIHLFPVHVRQQKPQFQFFLFDFLDSVCNGFICSPKIPMLFLKILFILCEHIP